MTFRVIQYDTTTNKQTSINKSRTHGIIIAFENLFVLIDFLRMICHLKFNFRFEFLS